MRKIVKSFSIIYLPNKPSYCWFILKKTPPILFYIPWLNDKKIEKLSLVIFLSLKVEKKATVRLKM